MFGHPVHSHLEIRSLYGFLDFDSCLAIYSRGGKKHPGNVLGHLSAKDYRAGLHWAFYYYRSCIAVYPRGDGEGSQISHRLQQLSHGPPAYLVITRQNDVIVQSSGDRRGEVISRAGITAVDHIVGNFQTILRALDRPHSLFDLHIRSEGPCGSCRRKAVFTGKRVLYG